MGHRQKEIEDRIDKMKKVLVEQYSRCKEINDPKMMLLSQELDRLVLEKYVKWIKEE